MVEANNYQMAIDLLCCHLGITEDEAKQQLGIEQELKKQEQVIDTQYSLLGLTSEK
ncbi:hypothetical protein [Vibrio mexicanus]|uniref:hypothetical protein n=1 Tax=Vibrio mexicanus TaxID=1004326 RepID=UPI000B11BD28|nr:hypothetical protein [Vibrio mexicanus]